MIANTRMYDVDHDVGVLWRRLLSSVVATAGVRVGCGVEWFEHSAPAPLEQLWSRPDMAAVFMCGLPFSRARPQPRLVAAPVPAPAAYGGQPRYWSEFVVRSDSAFGSVADTFGRRIAFTVPDSQSGCIAALSHLQAIDAHRGSRAALFAELVAPTITPLAALDAVIRGVADIAPIDSYAFNLLGLHRPELIARVRVVGRTTPTPIPPLVASQSTDEGVIAALSSALAAAHTDSTLRPLMDGLLLQRFATPDPQAYAILRQRWVETIEYWRERPVAAVSHAAFAW